MHFGNGSSYVARAIAYTKEPKAKSHHHVQLTYLTSATGDEGAIGALEGLWNELELRVDQEVKSECISG